MHSLRVCFASRTPRTFMESPPSPCADSGTARDAAEVRGRGVHAALEGPGRGRRREVQEEEPEESHGVAYVDLTVVVLIGGLEALRGASPQEVIGQDAERIAQV